MVIFEPNSDGQYIHVLSFLYLHAELVANGGFLIFSTVLYHLDDSPRLLYRLTSIFVGNAEGFDEDDPRVTLHFTRMSDLYKKSKAMLGVCSDILYVLYETKAIGFGTVSARQFRYRIISCDRTKRVLLLLSQCIIRIVVFSWLEYSTASDLLRSFLLQEPNSSLFPNI